MALDKHETVTVTTDADIYLTQYGITDRKTGDGTITVKVPPHVAKFFRDKGLVV